MKTELDFDFSNPAYHLGIENLVTDLIGSFVPNSSIKWGVKAGSNSLFMGIYQNENLIHLIESPIPERRRCCEIFVEICLKKQFDLRKAKFEKWSYTQ